MGWRLDTVSGSGGLRAALYDRLETKPGVTECFIPLAATVKKGPCAGLGRRSLAGAGLHLHCPIAVVEITGASNADVQPLT